MATFGLLGKTLKHSFSKQYFTEKFSAQNLPHQYLNFELNTIDELNKIFIKYPDLKGFNVTIPYKKEILSKLDFIDKTAQSIAAVNTVKVLKINDKYQLYGYNTDIIGFELSFKKLLKANHKKAMILGTGGASKAVEYVLKKLQIPYLFVSRTPDIAKNQISYSAIDKTLFSQYQIIINTSPLGQFPKIEQAPILPYVFLNKNYYLYDLIYNPEQTKFLEYGQNSGAIVKNGLEMLHIQAEKAWEIFGEN